MVHGLVADSAWARTWTDHGLGQSAATGWPRRWLRNGHERGFCADSDKLRTRSRTVCGHGHHGRGKEVVAFADVAQTPCEHASVILLIFPSHCADAALQMPGCFSGRSPDVARTLRRTLHVNLRGHYAAAARFPTFSFGKGMVSNQNTGFPIPESRTRSRPAGRPELIADAACILVPISVSAPILASTSFKS